MKKSIILGFALIVGATMAFHSALFGQDQTEACIGDSSRCKTKGNGDVIWGDWILIPNEPKPAPAG